MHNIQTYGWSVGSDSVGWTISGSIALPNTSVNCTNIQESTWKTHQFYNKTQFVYELIEYVSTYILVDMQAASNLGNLIQNEKNSKQYSNYLSHIWSKVS